MDILFYKSTQGANAMTTEERDLFLINNQRRILSGIVNNLISVPELADNRHMIGIWDRIFNCFVSGE